MVCYHFAFLGKELPQTSISLIANGIVHFPIVMITSCISYSTQLLFQDPLLPPPPSTLGLGCGKQNLGPGSPIPGILQARTLE